MKKISLKIVSMQGKTFNERLLVRNELMLSLSLQKLVVAKLQFEIQTVELTTKCNYTSNLKNVLS